MSAKDSNLAEERAREAFEKRASELLRESADGLDARIRSRLTQARYAAIEEARHGGVSSLWRTWVPAAGVAGAAALVILIWSSRTVDVADPRRAAQGTALDDIEMLSADESFDMLEDLDFYEWVAAAPPTEDTEIG